MQPITVYGIETPTLGSWIAGSYCMQPITVYGIETCRFKRKSTILYLLHAAYYRLRY